MKAEEEKSTASTDEAAVLAEINDLLDEGVLERVPDDLEFVVTEVIEPGLIEIGYTRPRLGPCRYPAHRPSDWIASDGRTVCGICHPPTPNARRPRG